MDIRAEAQICSLVGDWEPLKLSDVARSSALSLLSCAIDGLIAIEARRGLRCRLLCSGVCLIAAIVVGHVSHSTVDAPTDMYALFGPHPNVDFVPLDDGPSDVPDSFSPAASLWISPMPPHLAWRSEA